MRLAPSLLLSTLIVGTHYGADWTIDRAETKNINNQVINGVDLIKSGDLIVNSNGISTIKDMSMFFLSQGAGAKFNVQGGTLNLDLALTNPHGVGNHVTFNVTGGSTLTLTNGKNGKPLGIFQGSNTNLTANISGNSTFKGHLSNNAQTNITIAQGSQLQGNITQNGGSLSATLEGTLQGNVIIGKDTNSATLWGNKNSANIQAGSTIIQGNIIHEGKQLQGIIKGLELQGNFTQMGGTSDIAFHSSTFKNTTTLNGGNALLHFYDTKLGSLTSTGGKNVINLKGVQNSGANGSHMKDYTGINSNTTINLIEKSSMQSASQKNGLLTITAKDSSINGSITGDTATLNVTLDSSKIAGNISNSQMNTTIKTSNNTIIDGNITQNNGTLHVELVDTTLKGSFTQIEGNFSKLIATNTTIGQGIFLRRVTNTNPVHDIVLTNATINNGFTTEDLHAVFKTTMNNSIINGGYKQTGGDRVIFAGSTSQINGGIQVKNGGNQANFMTDIDLVTNSKITGDIVSTNHTIRVVLQTGSTATSKITLTGGSGLFKALTSSTFIGDLISQDTTNTKLYLDKNSKLKGNVIQSKGNQTIDLQNRSEITGSITNTDRVNASITLQTQSKLQGDLTQTDGKLFLGLGGVSSIMGNVKLNNVATTLNNGKTATPQATIHGDFTQNGGSLTGSIGGLTLNGIFTQNGGSSEISFQNATFQNPTSINNATLSKIIFNQGSNLKSYTLNDSQSQHNLLRLDQQTTLHGDFTLKNSSSKLSVWNQSKITGSVISNEAGNKLEMDIQSGGSIGGDLAIKNGSISGTINSGQISGDLKLTDADSKLNFIASTINGNIHIIRGTNEISLSGTKVQGWFKMEEMGPNDPTLKLKISNKSSILQDLIFLNTKAFLGGVGDQNVIEGNFISKNSTLSNGIAGGWYSTISGLTIMKDFQQENGRLNLIMENKSHIKGTTSIKNPDSFHLTLKNQSSMKDFEIEGGSDNELILENQSTQNGTLKLTDTKMTIKALNNSSITGAIEVISNNNFASETKLYLAGSSFTGDLTQNKGVLLLKYDNSIMKGSLILTDLKADINLSNSQIQGSITATNSPTIMNLSRNSKIDAQINLKDSNLTFRADSSTLQGNLTYSGDEQKFKAKLEFYNGSKLQNTKLQLNGSMDIIANGSTIDSDEIILTTGRLNISMDASNGVIKSLKTSGSTETDIITFNQSNSTITQFEISDDAKLSLIAKSQASISGTLVMTDKSFVQIESRENALIKFDITPQDQSSLSIQLKGGKLQGKITQNAPTLGEATLQSVGQFGGRWIMTDNSSLRSLEIHNSDADVNDRQLMLMGSENSKISMVDMTKDALGNSRIGLALIQGNAQNNQTTPRTLTLSNLSGQNGVFRIYTDLGSQLSDKVTTHAATGTHIMQVYYNPATFTQDLTGKHIVVAHVDDQQTQANFIGGITEIGNQAYQTALSKVTSAGGGFDWILGNSKNVGPSYGTKVIASILQSQYRSFAIQAETLNQRLGDLKDIERINGLWARYSLGSNQTQETQTHLSVRDNFYSVWVGYDRNTLDLRGQNFMGFALSYTSVTPDSKEYTGLIQNIGFNFYNVFVAKNDFYFDVIGKYILTHGSYDISYASLAKNTPRYVNHKLMINLEFGKKFKFAQDFNSFFYIQPEGQITSGYIHGNDLRFIDFSDTRIDANLGYTFPVIIRAGLTTAYSIQKSTFRADIRFGASMLYDLKMGGDVRLDDGNSVIKYTYGNNIRLVFNAGTNLILNNSSRIYLEASSGFLGTTSIIYGINAGVRFVFGPKSTRRLKVPEIPSPPPPPPEPPYDPRNIPTITDNTKRDIQSNNQPPANLYNGNAGDYPFDPRRNFRDLTSFRR